MPQVVIKPGREPQYPVFVGERFEEVLPSLVEAGDGMFVVVSDSHVSELYAAKVCETLRSQGITVGSVTFPEGEASKTRETKAALEDELFERGLGRDGVIIALGGGVTTDLAGFVAATFMRSIPFIAIPTSLLAMVDASVGGKTGVDHPKGKNLIGAFHHPRAVIADVGALETLPDSELDNGLAEMLKHLLIAGTVAELDAFIEVQPQIRTRDRALLTELVSRSVSIKAAYVERDARELGARAVLNVGHTIGHAVEQVSRYRWSHGEAVAFGMVAEAAIASQLGELERRDAQRIESAVGALGLPTKLGEGLAIEAIVEATGADKKARAGRVRYSLLRGIGEPARFGHQWTGEVPVEVVTEVLESLR